LKSQIININLQRAAKVNFILMWSFHCSMEWNLERKLLIRGRAFATLSTVEKAHVGRKKSLLCRSGLEQTPTLVVTFAELLYVFACVLPLATFPLDWASRKDRASSNSWPRFWFCLVPRIPWPGSCVQRRF